MAPRLLSSIPRLASTGCCHQLLRRADALLVPVLPSPIDMRAATRLIGDLLKSGRIARGQTRVTADRQPGAREHSIYQILDDFLAEYDIPLLTHLRESQNYIRSAETGLGIFELAPSQVAADVGAMGTGDRVVAARLIALCLWVVMPVHAGQADVLSVDIRRAATRGTSMSMSRCVTPTPAGTTMRTVGEIIAPDGRG